MAVIEINNENYRDEVLESDKKVLIDFWASWCGPCQMISPIIDKIAEENSDIKVVKVNVDEQPELSSKYQVMSIPTLVVIERGEVVNKSVGLISKKEIHDLIK